MSKMNPRVSMRLKRKSRIRKKIERHRGAAPPLGVSEHQAYLRADHRRRQGPTLVAAGTLSPEIKDKLGGLKKTDAAKEVGKLLADKAKDKGIDKVVFDRNGFLYHGRVKAWRTAAGNTGWYFSFKL